MFPERFDHQVHAWIRARRSAETHPTTEAQRSVAETKRAASGKGVASTAPSSAFGTFSPS